MHRGGGSPGADSPDRQSWFDQQGPIWHRLSKTGPSKFFSASDVLLKKEVGIRRYRVIVGRRVYACAFYMDRSRVGVCGIDFQSSVRFGTECQKIVRNRFGIKVRMRHLCNETCWNSLITTYEKTSSKNDVISSKHTKVQSPNVALTNDISSWKQIP